MRILKQIVTFLLVGLITPMVDGQVTADFTSNITTGCGSLQVSFSDLSTTTEGTIISWNWELGGVNSTNQDPGRIFGTPGSYTICLTATDSEGNSDTECKEDFIVVYNLPDAAFSVDNQNGCIPVTVTFTDQSNSVDGNITQLIWGIGGSTGVLVDDGSMPQLSSTYSNADSYTISLTVTDDNGCVNTLTEENFINAFDIPDIDISVDNDFNCSAPFIVTASNNNPEPFTEYIWNFGNGLPLVNAVNPPPTVYTNEGAYTITVIAENTQTNCSDTLVLEDFINVGNAVSFTANANQICQGDIVEFTNTSVFDPTNFQWDFGDGGMSTVNSPSYTFNTPGCYFVTLSGDIDGCTDTYVAPTCITVLPNPSANILNSAPDGCELPHSVQFNGITDIGTSFLWDFGDGMTSTNQNPQHTYTSFGIYPITFEVTDINGCTTIAMDTVRLIETVAVFDFNTITGCSPLNISLSEASISGVPITGWEWRIDTTFSDPNSPLFIFTDANPSFTISDTGQYSIVLFVTNELGCTDPVATSIGIEVGIPPVVDFEANPQIACVDEVIQFSDLSSDYADAWYWDFGDGQFSIEQNPMHAYNIPDTFDVGLIASHNGCESFELAPDYITVLEPLAAFSINRDCGNPYEIAFMSAALGADSTFWDFGIDGVLNDTSTSLTPLVTFPDTGCYMITQIVYNFTTLCVDSIQQNICIADPQALFSLEPQSGCAPLSINVENNSFFDAAWEWNAPGASFSNANIANPTITYNSPGIYSDIELIVTDIYGCQDSIMFTEQIMVDGVDASFNAIPSGGCNPLNVEFFENSTSFISAIDSYSYDIENGLFTSSSPNIQYFFDSIGAYTVDYTVTNEWGCIGNYSQVINVSTPTIGFLADTLSCPMDSVQFTSIASGDSLQYLWTFGDGGTSDEPYPKYQFMTEGNYEVCLSITDFAGCELSDCQMIEIVTPIADFSTDSTFASCPPLVVNFENLSQNSLTFEWDFGDNSGVSNLESPPHVYTVPGVYDVQLISSINDNCTDTMFVDDLILLEGPVGEFNFNEDTLCVGYEVTFWGSSVSNYTYIWDFGDGNLDTTFNAMSDTVTYSYPQAGRYVPKLILIDGTNCQRSIESPDTIDVALLAIDFIATDSTLCEGIDQTTFLNLTNSSRPIIDFEWYFENGSPETSTAFEPVVTFPMVGNFDVFLYIDNGFCSDTLFRDNYVGAGPVPVADFISSGTGGCVPYNIQLTDQSTVINGIIENWEWSFGGIGISNEVNPNYDYTTGGIFEVQLIVETEYGCTDTASIDVSLFEPASPFLSFNEPMICIGDVVNLNVDFQNDTTGLNYFWLADPSLSCTDCLSPLASPLDTTTYSLVTTTSDNCVDTSSITVDVLPFTIPSIMLTSDTTICIDDPVQLNVFSEGLVTYEWSDTSESLSCLDCSDPVAAPLIGTQYIVTVTNIFECDAIDTVFVDVVDQNQALIADDITICEGDTTQLNVLVDGAVNWLVSNALSCDDCLDPLAYPNTTTTYPFEVVSDDFGCLLMDTLTISVYYPDDIGLRTDTVICLEESIELGGFVNIPGVITWSPSGSLSTDTIANPIAMPLSTTTYTLNVEQDLCTLVDSVTIEVQTMTQVTGIDYVICNGDTVQLMIDGIADQFEWSPINTLSNPFIESPLAFPTETTTYNLETSLSTCTPDTASSLVFVNQGPTVDVPFGYDKFPGVDVQIDLNVIAGNGDYTYQWLRFDGLSCNNCPDPTLSIDTSGFYNVLVTDEVNGCTTESMLFINLLRTCNPDLLGVPNIFTPNDDSYNDRLRVYTGTITEIETFRIYNRWGALIFQTNDINEGWDGLYKGNRMPPGTYVYYIQAPCPIDGSTILKKGDFVLMR